MCKYTFKLISGCLRSYFIDKLGKEHILQFATEDWIINDMVSFVHLKPSSIYIDAIQESEILLLSMINQINLNMLDHEDLVEMNMKLFKNIIATNKRLTNLLSASAEERYLDFIETYPNLLQRIPLKLIASYLDMTPEYLSEIRKKIARK